MAADQIAILDLTTSVDDTVLKDQKEKVRRFRKRLHSNETFILPEIWDVISARIIADAGFDVIGVSPAAIAWGLGLKPEDRVDLEYLVSMAEVITRNFSVPVHAHLEGIVGKSVDEICKAVETLVASGCVGVTIGDGGRGGRHGIASIKEMTAVIKAAKASAMEAKVPLVIIAETEAFLLEPPQNSPFETAVERAEAYFAAGADCISVPGLQHVQIIERLTGVIDGPLSVTINLAPAPDLKSLNQAGVACVSLGSALLRSLLGTMRLKAEELLAFGHFNNLDKAISVDELNKLMS